MDVKVTPDQIVAERSPTTITPLPGQEMPPPRRTRFALSPINRRRWANFRANQRGYWSLWIFLVLFLLSLGRGIPRQRQADPRLLQGRAALPGARRLSGGEVRRLPRGHGLSRALRAGRDRGERLDAVAADPLLVQHDQQRDPRAGPGAPDLDARQGDALQNATPQAPTTRTARSGTGTGSAPTTRRATCWRGSSTASGSPCSSALR